VRRAAPRGAVIAAHPGQRWRLTIVVATAAVSGALSAGGAEPLEGTWSGQWVRAGAELDVTLTFAKTETGLRGTFDSEGLRVVGIPLQDVSYRAPGVHFRIVGDATTTVFDGTLQQGRLEGRFKEGAAEGTFAFKRAAPARVREESAAFRNGAVSLSGTFLLPEGPGSHPGVVFLHGSGAEGRWASRFLASRFTRRGFVALIYDKRGVGLSTGDWRASSLEDLVEDAVAAVAALRLRSDVDPARVGVFGHSQGGTIVPCVASRSRDIAFVVGSAASGVAMDEVEIFSVENALLDSVTVPGDVPLAKAYARALVATAYHGAPRQQLETAWARVREKPWAFAPPVEGDSYWSFSRRVAAFDPMTCWRAVSAPALLLYGEKDRRVPPRASAARISEAYLAFAGRRLAVRFFDGADHTFRLSSPRDARFSWPRSAPGYPDAAIQWALEALPGR
jgi:uncharacterized protein